MQVIFDINKLQDHIMCRSVLEKFRRTKYKSLNFTIELHIPV